MVVSNRSKTHHKSALSRSSVAAIWPAHLPHGNHWNRYEPAPYAKANIDILLNGKVVVDSKTLGWWSKKKPNALRFADNDTNSWQSLIKNAFAAPFAAPLMAQLPDLTAPTNKGVVPLKACTCADCASGFKGHANRVPDTLPFTPYHMFEFATGDIENCFGPDFSIYRGLYSTAHALRWFTAHHPRHCDWRQTRRAEKPFHVSPNTKRPQMLGITIK